MFKKFNYNFLVVSVIGTSIFFLPFTQLGIDAAGFALTLSDILLVVASLFLFFFPNRNKMPYKYGIYMLLLFSFIIVLALTAIEAKEPIRTFTNLFPWVYALLFLFVLMKGYTIQGLLEKLYYILIISLILSTIPSYLNIIGINIPHAYFHEKEGFTLRYSYFTTNSNQYAAYIITASSYVFLYSLKYCEHHLNKLLLMSVLFLYPMLESGSRTGAAVFLVVILFLFAIVFSKSDIKQKFVQVTVVTLLIVNLIPIGVFLFNTNPSFQRAIVGLLIVDGNVQDASVQNGINVRQDQFKKAFELHEKYPVLGLGLGNFKNYHHHEVHNTFIAIYVETGYVGSFVFIVLLLFPFYVVLFSSNNWTFKMLASYLLLAFYLMNNAHMFMRERWTWLFLGGVILIAEGFKRKKQLEIKKLYPPLKLDGEIG